jgi:hypothetical protein
MYHTIEFFEAHGILSQGAGPEVGLFEFHKCEQPISPSIEHTVAGLQLLPVCTQNKNNLTHANQKVQNKLKNM